MEAQENRQQRPMPTTVGQTFVINDFDNIVTHADMVFNYFMGNAEPRESAKGLTTLTFSEASHGSPGGSLEIAFDFADSSAPAPFAGYALSLFGLTEAKIARQGDPQEPPAATPMPGYYLDLLDIYRGTLLWPKRSVEQLQFDVRRVSPLAQPLVVTIELTEEKTNPYDQEEIPRRVYTHRTISNQGWHTLSLTLPNAADMGDFTQGDTEQFNPRLVSLLAFIVEGTRNPGRGAFLLDNIRLLDTDGEYPHLEAMQGGGTLRPEYTQAFLDFVRQTSFLYFVDFATTDPRTGGMIQDRSTFADLISVGGIGFQLTAYVIGAERGYISRQEAAARTHRILKILHDYPQGYGRLGTIGYKGFFYHLLGIDGLRKQNFDFKDSVFNESLNTVELSTIDTALALAGVLTARQYFNGTQCAAAACLEPEIRAWADAIYARVDWRFMLEPTRQQFYLGWKPHEVRDDDSGRAGHFRIPDADGRGQYTSKRIGSSEHPETLDFYTDEGLLVALLAIASPNPAQRVPDDVFCATTRQGKPFVKTFPGSLFTYQFGSVWLDMQALGRDICPARRLDYFDNTRRAILATRQYAIDNPRGHATLNQRRWGLSATEGPFDTYAAEAAPTAALSGANHCLPGGSAVLLEAEEGTGDGEIKPHAEASGLQTIWLHPGEARLLPFSLPGTGSYTVTVRYRNDGRSDTVSVGLDGLPLGGFWTVDMRPPAGTATAAGSHFAMSRSFGPHVLSPGAHEVAIASAADADGVEIDVITLEPMIVERPLEVGTVTVYGVGSAIVHTPEHAIAALWEAYRQGMFHARFGFGDAFNLNIADAVIPGCVDAREPRLLRATGPWKQFTGFAVDHGPMLALIDNYLANQFVPHLFMSYPTIREALSRLFPHQGMSPP
jgi:hypothetical protein